MCVLPSVTSRELYTMRSPVSFQWTFPLSLYVPRSDCQYDTPYHLCLFLRMSRHVFVLPSLHFTWMCAFSHKLLSLFPYFTGNRSFHQRVSSPTIRQRRTFALTRISSIPRSFIHCGAKQTAKYVYPELNVIQLISPSFINARYNLFLVLSSTAEPNGSRSDWHISVGELTFDVGESTSHVGELVVGELTRWRNGETRTRGKKDPNGNLTR